MKKIKLERANERTPLVKSIYTADPSAHVFDGKIYIYPSHDFEHDCPDDDNGEGLPCSLYGQSGFRVH